MKRQLAVLFALLLAAVPLYGCIEQPAGGSSSLSATLSTPAPAPAPAAASTAQALVPCPDHDPNMEVKNQNAAEPALLIAPDGEENLWIWAPSQTDETLGTLVSTPAAPSVIRWPEDITAETKAPLWFAESALYQSGERVVLCCAALEDGQQAVLFSSEDGGVSWNERRCALPFYAAGADCFLTSFGDGRMSAFISSAASGHSMCGFVQSAPGGEWEPLAASVTPPEEEQGAAFTWAGMVTDNIGFVCCGYKIIPEPGIYATNDGANSWFKLSLSLPEGFYEVSGYLTGSAASLDGNTVLLHARWTIQDMQRTVTYRSEDQGVSWQLTEVGDPVPHS